MYVLIHSGTISHATSLRHNYSGIQIFLEPPTETKIASKTRRVREIGGEWQRSTEVRETTFGSGGSKKWGFHKSGFHQLELCRVNQPTWINLACTAGEIFSFERSHRKKFSRHLEFFRQWKTEERKKLLPRGWTIGKRKDRGGGGTKKISSHFSPPPSPTV